MSDLVDLKQRVALITGAGQGVGRETALQMARHNARAIVVNDYFEDRAREVAREIEALGCAALPVRCDVSDYADVQAMMSAVDTAYGGLDILVNNAGNAGPVNVDNFPVFWEVGPEDWGKWFAVNLYGVMNCCHAALPLMRKRGAGRIVTIISDAGRIGEGSLVAYSAAKAGAAGFMRALAKAVGRFGIAANCVALGAIETAAVAEHLADPERRKKILSQYVIRRLGQPSDGANAILFLASDAASWVTGQTYVVNGGYSVSM